MAKPSALLREHPQERLKAVARKRGTSIVLDDKRSWEHAIGMLPDGPVVVRVELAEEARALELNRAYFATLRQIATYLNEHCADAKWDTDLLHEDCKKKFNGGQSTKDLPTRLFLDYMDRIRAHYAQEWGMEFPTPEAILEDESFPALPSIAEMEL